MRSIATYAAVVPFLCAAGAAAAPLNFDTLPADGVVISRFASATGWGYTLENTTANWILPVSLSSTGIAFGTLEDIFNYPVIAPGSTVAQPYVFNTPGGSGNSLGLFEYTGNPPAGTVQAGSFELLYQMYSDNPDVNPEAEAIGGTETVFVSFEIRSEVPEPGTAGTILIASTALAARAWLRRTRTGPDRNN